MKRLLPILISLLPLTLYASGPLEIVVPYQLSQLSPAVQQARIDCRVYSTATAPMGGLGYIATGQTALPLAGNSLANGTVTVKIPVPANQAAKSYLCTMQLSDGKVWSNASNSTTAAGWAKAGAGSTISVKGKVPPRPSMQLPAPPSNPGYNL